MALFDAVQAVPTARDACEIVLLMRTENLVLQKSIPSLQANFNISNNDNDLTMKGFYMRNLLRVIVFIGFAMLLAGCDYMPFGYIPIAEINRNPGRYEGEEIKVKGTVTDLNKLPFFETKNYTLRDKAGEIIVFTEGTLPGMGETVAIRATVKTTAIIGEQSFGLRLEERKRLPAYSFSK